MFIPQVLTSYIQYFWQFLKILTTLQILKPSKLHIFSKCWQHISNKNIHPPSVGIIYPIFLTIFENFNNFANFDIVDIFKIILSSMLCPQCRLSSMSQSRSDPILWDWKQETWQSVEWKWLPSTLIRRARARTNWHTLGHMRSTLWAVLYCFKLF